MNKKRKNNFITIHPLYTSADGSYFYLLKDDTLNKYETSININCIVEITKPIKDDYAVKRLYDNFTTYNKMTLFRINLTDKRSLYLFSEEYNKFKNIIKND